MLRYPALLLGTLGLALLLAQVLAPETALLLALLSLFGALLALERWLPYAPAWQAPVSRAELAHNLAAILTDRGVRVGVELGLVGLALGQGPLGQAPLGVQVALLLAVPDLLKYGIHRLSHRWGPLWAVHAVHHTPERVVVLNGLQMHPLNVAWTVAPDAAMVILAGPSPQAALIVGALRGAVALLQHANVDLRAGWLSPWLSTPDAHRWHHARDLAEGDHNYGATSLVWDWMFGTFRAPEGHPATLGTPERLPQSWLGNVLWPVCGARIYTTCFTARLRRVLA